MAGLSALHSKLRTLNNITVSKVKGKQVSVVYMNDDGSIDWPENSNSTGVLLVPRPCSSVDEWQARVDNNS